MTGAANGLGREIAVLLAREGAKVALGDLDAKGLDRIAYGTPDMVVDRLRDLRDELGLSGSSWSRNAGGRIPLDRVLNSIRFYAQGGAPRLRWHVRVRGGEIKPVCAVPGSVGSPKPVRCRPLPRWW